ncbi:hypothetical protein ACCO45_000883 [Purpureocillium lilacinum]|uniref:Uncharacterized protein n=1 Tax=Purpureocillium lilacinum TaxID=33203 RepID=A0ACC4E6V8_PURLI
MRWMHAATCIQDWFVSAAARLVWTVSIELASELIDCHRCSPFLRHGHGPQAHRSARRGKWREQRDVGGLSDRTRSASKSHSKRTRRRKSGGTQAGSGIAMARHGLVDGCGVMARVAGSSDQQPSGPDVGPRAYPCTPFALVSRCVPRVACADGDAPQLQRNPGRMKRGGASSRAGPVSTSSAPGQQKSRVSLLSPHRNETPWELSREQTRAVPLYSELFAPLASPNQQLAAPTSQSPRLSDTLKGLPRPAPLLHTTHPYPGQGQGRQPRRPQTGLSASLLRLGPVCCAASRRSRRQSSPNPSPPPPQSRLATS